MSAFLDEILAKVPEDQRAGVVSALAASPEFASTLEDRVRSQQAEFSRGMDGIKAKAVEQNDWWATHKEIADLGQKAKLAGFDPTKTGVTPLSLPDDVVRREELDSRERLVVPLTAMITSLAIRHLHEFGEPLDMTPLLKDPNVGTLGLQGVYDAKYAARYAEKASKADATRIAGLVEEGIRERMKTLHNPNAPSSTPPPGSPLDALKPVDAPGTDGQALADQYLQIVAGMGAQ